MENKYYSSKKDLTTYSTKEVQTLQKYYNVEDFDKEDILWILAIKIIETAKPNSMRAFMKQPDLTKFTQIIGAGGFGLVVKQENSIVVGKFLINPKDCNEAKVEFSKHYRIYEAFKTSQSKTNKYPQLCLSTPLDFSNIPAQIRGKTYDCYYLMTELPQLNENGIYHIINNDVFHEKQYNKVIGRKYSEPVSDENPSRGFFATYNYIDENILQSNKYKTGSLSSISSLLRYMGYSFGVILFIADLLPRDVEYVLGLNRDGQLCFMILDFGLTKSIDFYPSEEVAQDVLFTIANTIVRDILEIELYFPITDNLINVFKEGLTDAFNVSNKHKNKQLVYERIMITFDSGS